MSLRGSSVLVVLVVLAGVALGCLAASQPEWNFDSVGYAGAARRRLGANDADLHERVYADLRAAPAKAQREIAAGSGYRSALAADARAFASQLGFYSSKHLYVALVALAVRLGLNSVAATFYLSAAAYALLAIAWLLALHRIASGPLAWGVGLCILLSPPLRELGRLATPDALAALLAFAGVCALLFGERRRGLWLALASWLAAIYTRPDSAIFALTVLAWLAWCSAPQRRTALLGAALCGLACLAVSATSAYPWSTLITHTFFERVTDQALAARGTAIEPVRYLGLLARGLRGDFVLHASSGFFFVALSLVAVWARARDGSDVRRAARLRLHGLIWAAAGVHFLAFPMLTDRFFVAHYLTVALLATAELQAGSEGSRGAWL